MRVIHTIPSIDEEASGPSYSVPALSQALVRRGMDSVIATTDARGRGEGDGVQAFSRQDIGVRLGRSPDMLRWLRDAEVDILHNHSLWLMPNVYPGWIAKARSVPLIISPRGTLIPGALGRSRLKKFVMWNLWQGQVLRAAKSFHATSNVEYESIRRLGFRQPVAILPNGVDVRPVEERTQRNRQTVLFLGRLHPIKGVDRLLHAWSALEAQFPNWDLEIVGPGDAQYVWSLMELSRTLGNQRATFVGPLYGPEKKRAYEGADLFVLPTHSENFGMAIAEALAAGTPVVTTTGAPWQGLEREGAGWWVEQGVEPLVVALKRALSLAPEVLMESGKRGRNWILRDFSWDRISSDMVRFYEWTMGRGLIPPFVRLD